MEMWRRGRTVYGLRDVSTLNEKELKGRQRLPNYCV